MKIGALHVGQRPEIRGRKHPVDLIQIRLSERQRFQQHLPQMNRHRGFDFQAYRLAEAALAQLGLDRAQEVVRFVLLDVEVRIARDPEQVRRAHVHPGEERIEIVCDDVLEQDERAPHRARDDRHQARQAGRDLDARKMPDRALVAGFFHFDAE